MSRKVDVPKDPVARNSSHANNSRNALLPLRQPQLEPLKTQPRRPQLLPPPMHNAPANAVTEANEVAAVVAAVVVGAAAVVAKRAT